MNPEKQDLKAKVTVAPTDPGVYRWLDKDGTVLYVGKAKNIRNRLRSYINGNGKDLGPWKTSLMKHATDFNVIVVNSELEALVLETNLIKELRPKYNVMMKDDKNYVYVRISTHEPYPVVEVVRQMQKDKAKYFGPYLQAWVTHRMLDVLHEIYGFRSCKKSIETLNRAMAKGETTTMEKPCLEQQIGQCVGLCTGAITQDDYRSRIDKLVTFFKGDYREIKQRAKELMQKAATDRKFEKAAHIRDALKFIEDMEERQIVSDTSRENIDVIAIAIATGRAHAVIMRERGGKMIGEQSIALKGEPESKAEALEQLLPQIYADVPDIPDIIVVSEELPSADVMEQWLCEVRGKNVEIRVPERGKKSHLLDLAEKNAEKNLRQSEARWEAAARNVEDALNELQEKLNLPAPPKRIEGYDISHLSGTETVGSMVVIKDGKAANDLYRNFTLRTVQEGEIDDYKALREVLKRRLRHLKLGKQEEADWKAKGIAIGKPRKAETKALEAILQAEGMTVPKNQKAQYLIARESDAIIAVGMLQTYADGTKRMRHPWVREKAPQDLYDLMLRKCLQLLKKGKIYLITHAQGENHFAEKGFQTVRTAPGVMQEEMKAMEKIGNVEHMIMMYEAKQNKVDVSLVKIPDLLVIDGGKGQLSAAQEALKEHQLDIPMISLAKREEEVFVPGNPVPVPFPKDSQAKFLLMRLRDEAHRFANRHREARGLKRSMGSILDEVPGIGDKTKQTLLRRFMTVGNIQKASDEDLKTVLTESQVAALRRLL